MKEEHRIVALVHRAKENPEAADALIEQYFPFICSEAAKITRADDEDAVSIAMFAFYEAILGYHPIKGAFLKYAAKAIRNRLIDNFRKEARHSKQLSLEEPASAEDDRTLGERLAVREDPVLAIQERSATQAELKEFGAQLADFGLSFSDIADNCPKQERTLSACMRVLSYAQEHPNIFDQLLQSKKLPVNALVLGAKVERKTIERHRKYLVAILLAYTNGYEILRDHLKMVRRREVTQP